MDKHLKLGSVFTYFGVITTESFGIDTVNCLSLKLRKVLQ